MDSTVEQFLSANNIAVLGLAQEDGTIHSSSLHFAHQAGPLRFYFATEKNSYKCRPLIGGETLNASLVIGFSEQEFTTVQASGTVKIIADRDAWNAYIKKFPTRENLPDDEDMVLLEFTPTWWRYRDYKAKPMKEVSSNS